MADYTLGLDLGSNSVGWAMIADKGQTFDGDQRILAGVRVFPEGVESMNMKKEKPRGQQRREARSARRVHQRRSDRKRRIREILKSAGMLPDFPQHRKPLPELWKTDPYELRKKGLDEKLSLPEFGRVIYHICERRGFKSNRKSEKRKEDGKIAKEAAQLQAEMDDARCRTLGEYLSCLDETQRIRDRYTLREMYEEEFEKLWTKQASFHDGLTDELKEDVYDAIFFQRPITWKPESIGYCELEPGEKRSPIAHWLVQQFRVLQEVNNLRVLDVGGEERPLNKDERTALVDALTAKKEIKFDKVREPILIRNQSTTPRRMESRLV